MRSLLYGSIVGIMLVASPAIAQCGGACYAPRPVARAIVAAPVRVVVRVVRGVQHRRAVRIERRQARRACRRANCCN